MYPIMDDNMHESNLDFCLVLMLLQKKIIELEHFVNKKIKLRAFSKHRLTKVLYLPCA
jgi:hypothetical protein